MNYSSSRLNAHSMSPPSHNFFVVKKLFNNVTQDVKIYLGKFNNKKKIPIWWTVHFESDFTAINHTKKQRKFNITPYQENFVS